ncbi:MAG: hypothetical protein WBA22_19540 [Candidatus Methanofastidiosia archaeon]
MGDPIEPEKTGEHENMEAEKKKDNVKEDNKPEKKKKERVYPRIGEIPR